MFLEAIMFDYTLASSKPVFIHLHVQNEKGVLISLIRSDHRGEFENDKFHLFSEENGILHNFSTPRTPQQNVKVERKNKPMQEMARTMLNDNSTPKHF